MANPWPVVDGNFILGEPNGPVAVCTLTSESLAPRLATARGVAIAGQLYTANLGIERIILNVTSNPSIRFLLLCGKDSRLFRQGQSLAALVDSGIDTEGRIVGSAGYEPVVANVPTSRVQTFREQIELVDWSGEEDPRAIEEQIAGLAARNPGPATRGESVQALPSTAAPPRGSFRSIRPGGHREPLQYDPKGYFVISLDREEEQIVVQHYTAEHAPAHEMRGGIAEPMMLGLVREDLVSQLSHAAYLGGELAKAEAALHLDLRYRQDRPLTRPPEKQRSSEGAAENGAAGDPMPMPRIGPPSTLQQLLAAPKGESVDVVMEALAAPSVGTLSGNVLDPDVKSPFSSFLRTSQPVTVRWTEETKVVMGEPVDIVAGGIFRIRGVLGPDLTIDASSLVVLSNVATVV